MKEYKNIDDYLQQQNESERTELQRVRELIQQTVPAAEEAISYGMPTFKYKGKPLMHFAAFKDHLSIFPTSEPIAELQDKLKEFATGKGTLQYTIQKPIPNELIQDLLHIRVLAIDSK